MDFILTLQCGAFISFFRVILVGIAGPSGCGKTTFAKHLSKRLQSPAPVISLDKFFVRKIKINHPILGAIHSLEEPEALDIQGFLKSLHRIKSEWEKASSEQWDAASKKNNTIFIVVEGFLLFALSNEVTSMFGIRIFLDSTLERCRMQRFRRETKINSDVPNSQVKISEDFSRWYDNLVWVEYLKRRDLQMKNAGKVFKPEEYEDKSYGILDAYIDQQLMAIV